MDQKAVGEYLKRLRIRAKFTQTDLGSFIGVTDKAISRWESGAGMPEIGNLMVLAKLYGITVDDILNCNEAVFQPSSEAEVRIDKNIEEESNASATQYARVNAEQNNIVDMPAEKDSARVKDSEAVKTKTFSAPSNKFRIILIFAYFIMGTFLAAEVASRELISVTVFSVIFIVLVLTAAIMGFISKWLPRKVFYVVNIVLYSVMTASFLILFPLLLVGGAGLTAVAFAVLALLFLIQLFYVFYDFSKNENVKKIFNYCALGTAVAAFSLAFVTAIVHGIGLQSVPDYIAFSAVFAAIAALTFALAQAFSKWINILTAISVVPCAFICVCYRIFSFDIPLFDTLINTGYWIFDINFALVIAICAVLAIIIGWFFEGHKTCLTATRIASAVTFVVIMPLLVMTIDSFAVNVIFGSTERAAAVFIRIAVLTNMVLNCVKTFRFDLVFKSLKKGGVRNEKV